MKIRRLITICTFLLIIVALSACGKKDIEQNQNSSYPQKTIKIVSTLPDWATPTQAAKKIAEIIEKNKGWKFEFVDAATPMDADKSINEVWNAPHDGYTVLTQTENLLGTIAFGATDKTTKNWIFFEAFQEKLLIVVKADSQYNTIEDIVEAAKASPLKVGYPAEISAFSLKIRTLEEITGAKFEGIELGGQTVDKLLDNSLDLISAPMSMVYDDIKSGKIKPIIMTGEEVFDFGGNIGRIESIVKVYPEFKKYLPLDAAIGLAIPADAPKEAVEEFAKAFEQALNSPEMSEYISTHKATKMNFWGEDAKYYMTKMESNYTWLMYQIGMGKVNPETLGIEKPEWLQ